MPQLDIYVFSTQVTWFLLAFFSFFFLLSTVFLPRILFSLVVRESYLAYGNVPFGFSLTRSVSSGVRLESYFLSVDTAISKSMFASSAQIYPVQLFFASSAFSPFYRLSTAVNARFFFLCLVVLLLPSTPAFEFETSMSPSL